MMSQNKSNLPEGVWKIENYGRYDGTGWTKIDSNETRNIYLVFKNMDLKLVHNEKLVENISLLNDEVRLLSKNESLGLAVIRNGIKMRKIRIKFANIGMHSAITNARNCFQMLKKYVKLDSVDSHDDSIFEDESVTVQLTQHVSELLKKNVLDFHSDHEHLSNIYPLEDIIQSCILDVDFPSFVAEVNDTLMKMYKS